MAELILTEAEKAANTWLELDDATVGKLVKKTALGLKNHSEERGKVWYVSAVMLLLGMVADSNAEEFSTTINGFSDPAGYRGDFEINIKHKVPG